MATLTDLRTRVRRILGESTASFWSNDEIDDELGNSIREVSELAVNDLFKELARYANDVVEEGVLREDDGLITTVDEEDVLRYLSLWIEESDGDWGYPLKYVDMNVFQEIRRKESELSQDATSTRIWTYEVGATRTSGIKMYPFPVTGRAARLLYILKPSTTSTMTMPLILHRIVIENAISTLAAKKSRDLDMADRFDMRWQRNLEKLNNKYRNMYGMSPVEVAYIRDEMSG